MSLYTEIYSFFNEGRPRTVNKDVEDIARPGSGRSSGLEDDRGKVKTRYLVTFTRVDPGIEMTSKNVSEWIYQILSEKDRREIESLAKQVQEKKITEYQFSDKIEDYLWKEETAELPAGRILSLIRTDPKYSNISFDDIEEGDVFKIKKEIKPGPGGYIVTDKQVPDDYIEISVDDLDAKKTGAKPRNVKKDNTKRYLKPLTNLNPNQEKSSYKQGSVHKIVFNTVRYGRFERSVYTIYRKISENEFKNKNQNSSVQVLITPSDKEEHDQDVYYISIPKKVYDIRRGSDITYIMLMSKNKFGSLTSEEKEKLKIKLVPFEDISKGIQKTPKLSDEELKNFLVSNEKKLKVFTKATKKPVSPDVKKASKKEKNVKAAKNFFIIGKYGKGEDARSVDMLYDRMLRYYKKWKDSKELNNKKEAIEAEKNLVNTIENIIQAAFDGLENEEQVEIFVDDVLKDRITTDKKMGLYNTLIKTIYSNMKSLQESFLKEAKKDIKIYVVKTTIGSKYDNAYAANEKIAKKTKEPGVYLVALDPGQAERLATEKGFSSGIESIEDYEPEKGIEKTAEKPVFDDPERGKYGVILNLGGKEEKKEMSPKELMKYVRRSKGSENLKFSDLKAKVYDFSKDVVPGQGDPIKRSIKIISTEPLTPKTRTIFLNTDRATLEKEREKDEKEQTAKEKKAEKEKKDAERAAKPEMKTVFFKGMRMRVPVDYNKDVLKIKPVTVNPDKLEYKFYVVDMSSDTLDKYPNGMLVKDEEGNPLGSDDQIEARQLAVDLSKEEGKFYKVYRKLELKGKRVAGLDEGTKSKNYKLSENLTDEDKKTIKNKSVSFKIELGKNDPDAVAEVEGNVRESVYKDKKVTLTMDDGSKAVFSDPTMGKYYKNPNDLQNFNIINDTDPPLTEVLKKVFSAKKSETQLEAYIRQRIRRALQETELAQYFSVQGPDVKKKRLEEYMKKYTWGFQKSQDPYVRGTGSEKHAIVNKLVHELGDEGVAMFNSYAPKGYEIARPDDLNDMADTPLGSQLYQPYDPNSLTARGGRIAEEDDRKVISMAKPYIDAFNDKYGKEEQEDKYIENLAQGYVDKDSIIMDSETVRKYVEKSILEYIQKVSEKGTKKDIDPNSKILKALNLISNRKMTNYR